MGKQFSIFEALSFKTLYMWMTTLEDIRKCVTLYKHCHKCVFNSNKNKFIVYRLSYNSYKLKKKEKKHQNTERLLSQDSR